MFKIAHIINPVSANENSDLLIAQPITFETIRIAREFADGEVDVELLSAQYEEDRTVIPDYFNITPDLERSILDSGNFKIPRKLPILKDILDRLYNASNADYFIYTNVDIAVMPHFYLTVNEIINQGYDGFVINRRTISRNYKNIEEIPLMFIEIGERHKGYDCFIFRRDAYPKYRLGNVCLGTGGVGRVLLWNVAANANKFKEFKDYHLTFHLGNDKIWKNDDFNDYSTHNRQEAINVAREMQTNADKIITLNSYTYFRGYNQHQAIKSIINNAMDKFMSQHKFIFIAGLHKSGTTILADCLKTYPDIGSFSNTGFPKDEGQFLQSVFPIAREYGGAGKFGFNKEMHLTEKSPLINEENKEKLLAEWCCHWNVSKPVLLEKSPPNILKLRLLQAIFPHAYFIIITRHPVAVSYATQKWSKTSIDELLEHWITCHKIMLEDLKQIKKYVIIKYEDFVREPDRFLHKICEFAGIGYGKCCNILETDTNYKYRQSWQLESSKPVLIKKYEKQKKLLEFFGYSLNDL